MGNACGGDRRPQAAPLPDERAVGMEPSWPTDAEEPAIEDIRFPVANLPRAPWNEEDDELDEEDEEERMVEEEYEQEVDEEVVDPETGEKRTVKTMVTLTRMVPAPPRIHMPRPLELEIVSTDLSKHKNPRAVKIVLSHRSGADGGYKAPRFCSLQAVAEGSGMAEALSARKAPATVRHSHDPGLFYLPFRSSLTKRDFSDVWLLETDAAASLERVVRAYSCLRRFAEEINKRENEEFEDDDEDDEEDDEEEEEIDEEGRIVDKPKKREKHRVLMLPAIGLNTEQTVPIQTVAQEILGFAYELARTVHPEQLDRVVVVVPGFDIARTLAEAMENEHVTLSALKDMDVYDDVAELDVEPLLDRLAEWAENRKRDVRYSLFVEHAKVLLDAYNKHRATHLSNVEAQLAFLTCDTGRHIASSFVDQWQNVPGFDDHTTLETRTRFLRFYTGYDAYLRQQEERREPNVVEKVWDVVGLPLETENKEGGDDEDGKSAENKEAEDGDDGGDGEGEDNDGENNDGNDDGNGAESQGYLGGLVRKTKRAKRRRRPGPFKTPSAEADNTEEKGGNGVTGRPEPTMWEQLTDAVEERPEHECNFITQKQYARVETLRRLALRVDHPDDVKNINLADASIALQAVNDLLADVSGEAERFDK